MKNMEINKKLGFKVVAVLTSASMILGGLAGCGKDTSEDVAVVEQSAETDENDDLLSNVMNQVVHRSSTAGTEPRKDEVVYVMADAQGNTQKIIVSDCLKNANGESTIKDASSLTDIQNVKGNESYTVDENGNLVWNAEGSDIYYQGTTDKQLPVDVAISYELEGKEISPEDLAGKSGNVTIRFIYTNNEKTTVEVNGKEKEVYVPFAMISGAILPAEHFSDIEVTNGKVISEGNNNIVVGLAFPGLKDSVNIDSLKEKAVDEEAKEKLDEVEIPETVEIHAYATDFEMNQTMTMAMSDLLSDLKMDDTLDIDTSKITDSMNELQDATQQLKDGSTELNDGAATLQEGAQILADKSRDLDSGAGELVDGISTLNNGAGELNNGAGSLKDGIDQVNSGAGSLFDGAAALNSGVQTLKNGTSSLVSGAGELNSGAAQLKDGITKASNGVNAIKAGFEKSSNFSQTDATTWGLNLLSQTAAGTAQKLAQALGVSLTQLTTQMNEMQTEVYSMGEQLAEAKAAVGELGNVPSRGASYDEIAGYYANAAAPSNENSSSSSDSSSSGSSSYESSSDEGSSDTGSSNESSDSSDENSSGGVNTDAGSDTGSADENSSGETSSDEGSSESGSTESVSTQESEDTVSVQSYEVSAPAVVVVEESFTETSEETSTDMGEQDYGENDSSDSSYEDADNSGNSNVNNSSSTNSDTNSNSNTESAANTSYVQEEPWNDRSTGSSYEGGVPLRGASYDEIAEYYYKLGQMNAYENVEQMLPQGAAAVSTLSEDENGIAVYADESGTGSGTGTGADPATELKTAAAQLVQLTAGVDAGIQKVYGALGQLQVGEPKDQGKGGFVALNAGAAALAKGTESAVSGAKQLDDGAGQLAGGTSQLLAGTNTLKDGTSQLLAGAQTLKDGTQTLQDGTLELLKGGQTLKDGTSKFVDGTAELNDGARQLLDGTGELMDGLFTFDEEGISKLTDLFGDNVQDVIDELKAVCDAGRGYKIYSDSASDMDSSVKFIYKTEAVK